MSELSATSDPAGSVHATEALPRAALADRGQRFIAAGTDNLIAGVPAAGLGYWLGLYDEMLRTGAIPLSDQLAILALSVVVYLAIHGHLLFANAQTVGKKLLGVVVVDAESGQPIDGNRYVFQRLAPMWLAGAIPFLGVVVSIVDVLLIFRADRRCLHDHIARSRVVKC